MVAYLARLTCNIIRRVWQVDLPDLLRTRGCVWQISMGLICLRRINCHHEGLMLKHDCIRMLAGSSRPS